MSLRHAPLKPRRNDTLHIPSPHKERDMHRHFLIRAILSIALLAGTAAHAADAPPAAPQDNAALAALHAADQEERKALFQKPAAERQAAMAQMARHDAERLREVRRMLRNGEVRTAADHWRAAFVYQHGDADDDIRLAFSLGMIAATLAPERKDYRWIAAAAWDRLLVRRGQPQWYGTQFAMDAATGRQIQSPIAEGAVSDADRQAFNVPTLAESARMLEQINAPRD